MTARPRARDLVAGALLAALLATLIGSVLVQIWDQPIDVPFQYATAPTDDEQDMALEAMVDAQVIRTGWFFHEPRLNAPDQQDWIEWPMGGDTLAYVIKKGIATTTDDPFVLMNVFWLLTFPLVAAAAYPAVRLLGCSAPSALVGSVLFAFAPYHLRNGVGHENLAFYVAIPFAVVLLVRLLGPDPPLLRARTPAVPAPDVPSLLLPSSPSPSPSPSSAPASSPDAGSDAPEATAPATRRGRAWTIIWPLGVAALLAVDSYYYLVFFGVLGAACAATSAWYRKDWRPLASMAILGGAALVVATLVSLPTILWTASAGPNPMRPLQRVVGSTELFALRPVELLTPVAGHRIGFFDTLSEVLSPSRRAWSTTANLGLYAAIGVVVALVELVRRAARGVRPGRSIEVRIGIVVAWALVIGAAGGASRVLDAFGVASIRAWSRVAIFIAFAGVVVAGRLLDRLARRLAAGRPALARVAWPAVLVAVLVLGVLDQVAPATIPDARANAEAFDADAAFVAEIEARVPEGAMVFQLPVVPFPEAASMFDAADYDQLNQGYLHSDTLRWSAGGIQGRSGDWQVLATAQPAETLVRGLAATGFSAITLDQRAYEDGAATLVDDLTEILGPPFATSRDRLLAWDLQPYRDEQLARTSQADRDRWRDQTLYAPRVYIETDSFDHPTRNPNAHLCRSATATVIVPDGYQWEGSMDLYLPRPATSGDAPTIVTGPDGTVELPRDQPSLSIPLDAAGTTVFTIEIPSQPTCDDPASRVVLFRMGWTFAEP